MLNHKSFVFLMILLFAQVILVPDLSYACSCIPSDSVRQELALSDVVFTGKVLQLIDKNKEKPTKSSADPIAVHLQVKEIWKGLKESEVIIYTERDTASCGFPFEKNQEYIVYAMEDDGELRASICSRTAPLLAAPEDIEELGKGQLPSEQVKPEKIEEQNQEKPSNTLLVLMILLIIGIFMILYVKWRTKKPE